MCRCYSDLLQATPSGGRVRFRVSRKPFRLRLEMREAELNRYPISDIRYERAVGSSHAGFSLKARMGFRMTDKYYYEPIEAADLPALEAGRYAILHRLWDAVENPAGVTEPGVLDRAERHASELKMASVDVGVPGWQGELASPAVDLAWFAEKGFSIFAVLDGKGDPGPSWWLSIKDCFFGTRSATPPFRTLN